MRNLNLNEQRKIAKMCAEKGMPLEDIKNMGININEFSVEDQAELHGMFASKKIDRSIENALIREEEER